LRLIEKIGILEDQIILFLSLIGWNQGCNHKKIKFGGQSRVKIKKFKAKDLYTKGVQIQSPNSIENKGEIEEN
jgi:hypothetical protein